MPPVSPVLITAVVSGILLLAFIGVMFASRDAQDQVRSQEPVKTEAQVAEESRRQAMDANYHRDLAARQRDEAYLRKLNADRKAEEDAQVLAARGPKPVPSEWDGITPEANAFLRANLKDYDSMKIVTAYQVVPYKDNAWAQMVKIRARNGFGAYTLETWAFVIRNGKVIDYEFN